MRKLLVLLLAFPCMECFAQPARAKNNDVISFELGKTGLVYNLTYDHRFRQKPFGFRATVGGIFGKTVAVAIGGGGMYLLAGKQNNFFETGVDMQHINVKEKNDDQRSVVFFYPDYEVSTWYYSLNLGYRHYWRKGMLRIGLSPGSIEGKFIPGGYVSIGAAL